MSKQNRGHYCKICDSILSNEKFSGKGHKNHICKRCSPLSNEDKQIRIAENRLYKLYEYNVMSKNNKKMLKKYRNDKREKIKNLANEIYNDYYGKYLEKEYEQGEDLDENYPFEFLEEFDYLDKNYTADDVGNIEKDNEFPF